MIIVRVILVETTLPVKIRPRIEMSPVKGHFLSEGNKPLEPNGDKGMDSPM